MLTPEVAKLRGRIGAHRLHSKHDTLLISAPGRAAARARLEERLLREVDPERMLPPEERERRLRHALKAHFASLALRSAQARRRRKGASHGA